MLVSAYLGRADSDQREVDFIRKWIFPGGFLPTVSFVTDSIRVGAKNKLVIDSIANIGVRWRVGETDGSHTTLARSVNGEDALCTTLNASRSLSVQSTPRWTTRQSKSSSGNGSVSDSAFKLTKDYFCYCEVGFSERVLGDHIFTIVSWDAITLTPGS